MDKKEDLEKSEDKISVCDIMKNTTSEIIRKRESQIPTYAQLYSDLYTEYLHMFDDLFGTCYMAEKEFFDKMGIDQNTLKQIRKNSEDVKSKYLENMDMTVKFFDAYVKMHVSAIKSFDSYVHIVMESYAKMLAQFNESVK